MRNAYCAPADLLVLAPFHSGSVSFYDVEKEINIATLPVEDGAGVVNAALTADGRSVYVVDGNSNSRVRLFDTKTWTQTLQSEFRDRVLSLSATQTTYLAANDRWLLIDTYDLGAAAHGVRMFDTRNRRFAPIGLSLNHCAAPLFSGSQNGPLVAITSGSLEIFTSKNGESLTRDSELQIPLAEPATSIMSKAGDKLFVLGRRNQDASWLLVRVSLGSKPTVESWDLTKVLAGKTAARQGLDSAVMALDRKGETLLIASGAEAWLLGAKNLNIVRALHMPGAVSGAGFSSNGHTLYTLQRDDPNHSLLLGKTEIAGGTTKQSIIMKQLPLSPIHWQFSVTPDKDVP